MPTDLKLLPYHPTTPRLEISTPTALKLTEMLDNLVETLANPSNDELRALVEERLETMGSREAGVFRAWICQITPLLEAI